MTITTHRLNIEHRRGDVGGQALIELVVALIAILVLTAALLQLASLTRAHLDAMTAARRTAGELALLNVGVIANPRYILDWQAGADNKRHTKDDTPTLATVGDFNYGIIERTVADPADWTVLGAAPADKIALLHDNPNVAGSLGLVKGEAQETVSVIPAVRHFIYDAGSINVEASAWMTLSGDIY